MIYLTSLLACDVMVDVCGAGWLKNRGNVILELGNTKNAPVSAV